jgi:hypothetical protein
VWRCFESSCKKKTTSAATKAAAALTASANTHKQQRSCDCVHQRIHPAMWWHCCNNCQDELPIVSSTQLIPNVKHVHELFVHERDVDQLFGVEDDNPSFPSLTTVIKWCCEGRAGRFGVCKRLSSIMLACFVSATYLSAISFLSWDHSWVLIPQSSYVQTLRKQSWIIE